MKKILLIAVIIATAIGGWYWWQGAGKDKGNATPPVLVSTAPATRRDMPITVEQVGNVIAYETVAVRSRLDSQVVGVNFKDGDYVEKGALLFQLDDRALKAQEKNDQAQADNTRLQYERAKALAAQKFVSQDTLDTARANYRSAQAVLDNVRVQIDYTRITAPISGRAGTINITVGNNVKANDTTPLVTINQVKPIRVQLSLSQDYFADLRGAMNAGPVAVQAQHEGDEAVSGTLEYIDNAVDATTGTFATRAVFTNENEMLWPGMFVNVRLTLGETKQAITVPEVAVQQGQSGYYAFVIDAGKAHKRDVKLTRMQENIAVIADGLAEGEQVATDGLMNLKDGAEVKVRPEKKDDSKTDVK